MEDEARTRTVQPSAADLVTALRAGLVVVVGWFVLTGSHRTAVLVTIAAVALVLDAVDGRVARRTGRVTAYGARFDMEVDAALVLVLSVYVAPHVGAWVLLIGAARYLLLVAGWLLPWLERPSPPRYWAKVVAAVQGVTLVVVAADLLPRPVEVSALVVALVLLVESFGHQVTWLVRHRADLPVPARGRAGPVVLTVLAVVLVWVGLTLPDQIGLVHARSFLVLPL
ncbi:MAG: CDP-alcohol phosphatidyltransferase, partial [Nocardioidaceae bacterium]|nr:CDP-alcohol phosphatidyltransferase [Nocardioidaceae bacterium]